MVRLIFKEDKNTWSSKIRTKDKLKINKKYIMNHCMPIKSNEGNGCISGKVCNSKIDLGKKRFVWTYNL